MSNNKQSSSSIDWLISQLQKSKDWHRVLNEISQMSSAKIDIIAEAKAMHKQENLQTWLHCLTENDPITFEDYYNETFGGNNERNLSK